MEQQNTSYTTVCDQLLPLCAKYPWFVAENLGAEEDSSTDHIFYTLHDPLSKYQCQIPEFRGRHIRGYYHGWVILSNSPQNVMWSLWNPVTSKTIDFPPLILKDGDSESIGQCCLSAPPDNPNSVLLLTRTNKPTFVFFRVVSKRTKPRWIEMSYTSQLKQITGEDGLLLYNLACCNGKVYALNLNGSFATFVIQLDIVVKEKEVLIKLLLLGISPFPYFNRCTHLTRFLKGSCRELFYFIVGFYEGTLEGVYFFKLDMTSLKSKEMERFKDLDMTGMDWKEVEDYTDLNMSKKMWEELVDLKEAIFFLDLAGDRAYYRPAVASELGGYIHIRDRMGKILYSYHVKDNTISLSSMPSHVLPTSNVSVWECRLEDDHGKAKCTVDSIQKDDEIMVRSLADNMTECNESCLLNLPFDNLEMIMGFCVGVEYLNFRASCKLCHSATPLIKWRGESALKRLQAYSLLSPWLMVVDKNHDIISFTDPLLGDNYFMRNQHVSLAYQKICCSRFGWLLYLSTDFRRLVFFNPFTRDLRKLPKTSYYFKSLCFSAPPTSPDCLVVGFTKKDVYIHFVGRKSSWRTLGIGSYSIRFPTFIGRDLYALRNDGELIGFKNLGEDGYSGTVVKAKAPRGCYKSPAKYYLMSCDQDLLLVIVGEFGEHVEVFKWIDSTQEWKNIDSVGKHMIYICGTTCVCIKAKTPQMENKIYFPVLHSKNRKMVFYSLETCMYHTFNGETIQQNFKDLFGTTYHLFPHAWIEPSWS